MIALVVMLQVALLAAHPDSVSSSRITVSGTGLKLELRSEERTFLEALPLDADRDGELSPAELAGGATRLAEYVASRYRLVPLLDGGPGAELAPRFLGARALERGDGLLAGKRAIQLAFEAELPAGCEGLSVTSELFVESDPLHRDQCELVWNGAAPATKLLWAEDPTWTFRARSSTRPNVVREYTELGVRHILGGLDHLAFVLALVVAARSLRALVGVVSAFTLAHSLTLASASLGWIVLPARSVEIVIALSIVFVALRNLFEEGPRRLWPEAFGFGLVHGLGFAGALADTLAVEPQKLRGLFGFNLGVEIGQLAVVLAAVGLLALLRQRTRTSRDARLAPRWVRVPTSALVALAGSCWVIARVAW